MNIYLYPWHTDVSCEITKVLAKNYEDCEDRIKEYFVNRYFDMDDRLDFDDFCEDLGSKHGIYLGYIYELDEFM